MARYCLHRFDGDEAPVVADPKGTYDLHERTAVLGEEVIDLAKKLRKDNVNRVLVSQVVRSATSIGANYAEADGAGSKREFRHRIGLCRREAKETMHWLRMLAKANEDRVQESRRLWQEAHELALIFSAILRSAESKAGNK